MRILLFGQRSFGAMVLQMFHAVGHEVVAVVAPSPEEGDALRTAALERRIPAYVRAEKTASANLPRALELLDLVVGAHAHTYIDPDLLARARYGGVAYHPSLLPLHRGRDALRWTIAMRDRVTGGTVYRITEEVDAGPVLAQRHCFVLPNDTPSTLWRRELFPLGIDLLRSVISAMEVGEVVASPQDERLATWEPSWERQPMERPA